MEFSKIYYNPSNPAGYGSIQKLMSESGSSRKDTLQWLSGQDSFTLHRKKLRKFPRRKTMVSGVNVQYQVDLVDMVKYARYNSNYKYILTAIDVFSRYAYAIPLKNKTGVEVVKALKKIFVSNQPLRLQSDYGVEFYNIDVKTFLAKRKIDLFSTSNETKAAIVERFNRTLKERMFRYFTKNNTYRYLDILNDMVSGYNTSVHRIIKMRPIDVTKENEKMLWERLYGDTLKTNSHFRFEIGDVVRISKMKDIFEKGYTPNWTREYFYIIGRRNTNPVTYKLKDSRGEVLKGSFYEPEIQKIKSPTDETSYPIDIIRRKKMKNNKMKYYVHYRGWPDSFNEWIDAENLM